MTNMCSNNRKCVHEVAGPKKDIVLGENGSVSSDNTRECELLQKPNSTERASIEQTARDKGAQVRVGETRCPYYSSGISQQDCPYFK